jgi:hypothetical protein
MRRFAEQMKPLIDRQRAKLASDVQLMEKGHWMDV